MWNDLSMSDKNALMQIYIKNGVTSLDKIKDHYNSFATDGQMNTDGSKEDENNKGHVTFGTYDENGNIIPKYYLKSVNVGATQPYRTPEQEAQVTRERNMYFDAMRHFNYGNQDAEGLKETYAKYPELRSYLKRIGMSENDFMSAATGRDYETNSYERERTRQFNKDIQKAEADRANTFMQAVQHQNPNDQKLAAIMTGILGGVTGTGILGGLTQVGQGVNALNTAKTVGKTALNFMGRPVSTLASAQGWTNILPAATAFDQSLMGTLGLAGVYDATSRGIKGEIPWYDAIGEGALSGLMTMDLYPALKGGVGLVNDAANAVNTAIESTKLGKTLRTVNELRKGVNSTKLQAKVAENLTHNLYEPNYGYRRIHEPIPTLKQAYQYNKFVSQFTNTPQTLALPQSTGIYPQIKPLIKGAEIEKQLSKTGTISRKSLDAYIAKQGKYYQDVMNEALESEFKGVDKIDYVAFQDAVQKRLPEYNRVKQTDFEDYGLNKLGFKEKVFSDAFDDPRLEHFVQDDMDMFRWRNTRDLLEGNNRVNWYKENLPELNTFTFESPNISGNTKHYKGNPIGHSRTYTTKEEPNVLHVMESQSDWAQNPRAAHNIEKLKRREARQRASIEEFETALKDNQFPNGMPIEYNYQRDMINEAIARHKQDLDKILSHLDQAKRHTLYKHMTDTYTERQIQENLRYAAEQGQTKMRYPTRETAAKIEGYPRNELFYNTEGNQVYSPITRGPEIDTELESLIRRRDEIESLSNEFGDISQEYSTEYNDVINRLVELTMKPSKLKEGIISKIEYNPEHETILKKYDAFPKQFQKLFGKKAEVRTVTDSKGNTWYEVDVPESYRNKTGQIIFSAGGLLGLGISNQNQ